MKILLLTALLLGSLAVYGQEKKNLNELPGAVIKSGDSLSRYLIQPSDLKPSSFRWFDLNKKQMEISAPDSNGVIKVWINKKEIKWTSDSTFVIQGVKPKNNW